MCLGGSSCENSTENAQKEQYLTRLLPELLSTEQKLVILMPEHGCSHCVSYAVEKYKECTKNKAIMLYVKNSEIGGTRYKLSNDIEVCNFKDFEKNGKFGLQIITLLKLKKGKIIDSEIITPSITKSVFDSLCASQSL